jgi:hypothetical protein
MNRELLTTLGFAALSIVGGAAIGIELGNEAALDAQSQRQTAIVEQQVQQHRTTAPNGETVVYENGYGVLIYPQIPFK